MRGSPWQNPILDIDVNDEAFQRFRQAFDKYQDAVKELPEAWSKVSGEISDVEPHFAEITAALVAEQELLARSAQEAGRFANAGAGVERVFGRVRKHTLSILDDVAKTAKTLAKWGVGITLGGTFGGLWGIDRLAGGVGGDRRSSQGLGLTVGQQKAFELNYGRFYDTHSVMENIANAQANPADRWAFGSMGVSPEGKNPADLAAEMTLQAKKIFEEGGGSQQYAEAHGLLKFFTMNDLRRLHEMSVQEIRDQELKRQADQRRLGLDDQTARSWQNLKDQFSRAVGEVETAIVKVLTPLTGNLDGFSRAVADFITEGLGTKAMGEAIDWATKQLQSFTDYIKDGRLRADLDALAEKAALAWGALGRISEWLQNSWLGRQISSMTEAPAGGGGEKGQAPAGGVGEKGQAQQKYSYGAPQFAEDGTPVLLNPWEATPEDREIYRRNYAKWRPSTGAGNPATPGAPVAPKPEEPAFSSSGGRAQVGQNWQEFLKWWKSAERAGRAGRAGRSRPSSRTIP